MPVYLHFPWLGSVSTQFERQVKSAVKVCFSAVKPRVVSSTNELHSATSKDVLPALQKSNVIYRFSCHYDNWFVGRTSKRLQEKIKQHVPKSIRSCFFSQTRLLPAARCHSYIETNTQSLTSDSAIGLHLSQNSVCTRHYDESIFSILSQGRFFFHLHLFLKPFSSKLLIPSSADKKNLLMTLSHWSFSSHLWLYFFL